MHRFKILKGKLNMMTYIHNLSTQEFKVIHNLEDQPELQNTLSKVKKGGEEGERKREVSWEGRRKERYTDTQRQRDRAGGKEGAC